MTVKPINFGQIDQLIRPEPNLELHEPRHAPESSAPAGERAISDGTVTRGTVAGATVLERNIRSGQVVTFRSLTGGVGKSLVALNFAFEAAAMSKQVCLVDLDFQAPSLHRWFGLSKPRSGVTALARLIEQNRLDQETFEKTLLSIEAKQATVSFLGLATAQQVCRDPKSLEVLLEYLSLNFQVVVLDASTGHSDLVHQICDRVSTAQFVVVQADPISLGRHLDCESSAPTLPKARLLINRLRDSALGSRAEWQVSQTIGARSQYPIAGLLPDHPEAVDHAMLSALPLRQAAPKSPLLRAIGALVVNHLEPTRQSKKLGGLTKL